MSNAITSATYLTIKEQISDLCKNKINTKLDILDEKLKFEINLYEQCIIKEKPKLQLINNYHPIIGLNNKTNNNFQNQSNNSTNNQINNNMNNNLFKNNMKNSPFNNNINNANKKSNNYLFRCRNPRQIREIKILKISIFKMILLN